MPWLSLKRLMPPRKVWKVLTNKLQLNLHKLNRSKAIKKSKIRHYHKTSKRLGWPSLSIQPKKFKRKPNPHSTFITHQNLHKRPAPVYVDQLFIEPGLAIKEREMQSLVAGKEEASIQKSCPSENGSFDEMSSRDRADEMWESLVLGSPGINERAEAFIARFRADMHHQEMLARRL